MTRAETTHDTDTLQVRVTEEATVFSGAANLRRCDAPTPLEIATYIRSVFGDEPHGAQVHLIAEEQVIHLIDQALADYGIHLTAELPADEAPTTTLPAVHTPEPLPVARPRDTSEDPESRRAMWLIVGLVVVVAAACGLVLWWTFEPSLDDAHETAPEPAPVESSSAVSSSAAPEPEPEVLEQDGLSVQLPAGFSIEEDGDMWRAVGPDPNFRLQLSVDERYNVPAQALAEQLREDIERDPEVELVGTDGHAVTYLERAADGSQALWKTWPDGAVQLSVGCHTRYEPTKVQQATCTMAMNSARFAPENSSSRADEGVVALEG